MQYSSKITVGPSECRAPPPPPDHHPTRRTTGAKPCKFSSLHSQVPTPSIPLNLFSNVPRSTYKFLPYQSLSHLRRRVPVVGHAGEGRPHSSRCCSRESSRHLALVMAIIVHLGRHNFKSPCFRKLELRPPAVSFLLTEFTLKVSIRLVSIAPTETIFISNFTPAGTILLH